MSGRSTSPNVAIFLHNLKGGGAERMMVNLANGISDLGYRLDMVLCRAQGPYLEDVSQGIRMIDLKSRRTLAAIPRLARYLRRERPEALLSALTHINVAAIAATRLARAGNRLVVSERNTISRDSSVPTTRMARLAYRSVSWTYRFADGIVAVSRGVAEDLARYSGLPRSRIETIDNPVITPRLLELAARSVSHPWFQAGEPPVILAVGRLVAQKGFSTLLKAFFDVRRDRTTRLMILGEGPERTRLQTLVHELGVANDVKLPGFVENPFAFMRAATLLALSSRFEGSPNVLVEAMACGTPVVATDCPNGPAEILKDGKYGPLVPVDAPGALADAIRQILDDPVEQSELRRRAADYSADRSAKRYIQVLFGEHGE